MENRIDILNELKALSPAVAAIEKVNVFTVPQGYFDYLGGDILMGIETENRVTNTNSPIDDIPAGYFDSLAGSILAKIKVQDTEGSEKEMSRLSAELTGLGSKTVFEVPPGYFETLAASILTKIRAEEAEDAATEIRTLSPMLYSIQNENVFEVPTGYFESLGETVLNAVIPQVKVVSMKSRRVTFFKYAVAAVFTGVIALGVFKFTSSSSDNKLPDYVTAGLQVQDVDQELAKISDADIIKYLEENGTDVKTALVVGSTDNNELPSEEEYLLDEKALDKYLNSINIDQFKN